jgi:sensor histidine kinase regulating citrate/malate metabolism
MRIFLIIGILAIFAVLIYLLVKVANKCQTLEEDLEKLQLKSASVEAERDFIKQTVKKTNNGIANALVHLCAMGPQDEHNKVYLIAAQKELMEVNEKLEKL